MKKPIKLLLVISLILTLSLSPCIVAEASDGATHNDPEASENIFERLYDRIGENATEIFCAMTFTASMALAFAYKKGLVPLLQKTLLSIGNSVTKIKETAESGEAATEELGVSMTEKLDATSDLVQSLEKRIDKMHDTLADVIDKELSRKDNADKLNVIVKTQVDMLYDIFMSSALPQYQKDAVGEKVAKMKEALGKDVAN